MIAGRNFDCDIVVDYTTVSRKHLKIRGGSGNKVFITDLGSSNGSYLNRDTIEKNIEIEFKLGKRLELGDSDKILILEEENKVSSRHHQSRARNRSSSSQKRRKRSIESSHKYKRRESSNRERSRSNSPPKINSKKRSSKMPIERREHRRIKPKTDLVDLREIRESASTEDMTKLKLLKDYIELRSELDPKEISNIKLKLEGDIEEFNSKAKAPLIKHSKRKYL